MPRHLQYNRNNCKISTAQKKTRSEPLFFCSGTLNRDVRIYVVNLSDVQNLSFVAVPLLHYYVRNFQEIMYTYYPWYRNVLRLCNLKCIEVV